MKSIYLATLMITMLVSETQASMRYAVSVVCSRAVLASRFHSLAHIPLEVKLSYPSRSEFPTPLLEYASKNNKSEVLKFLEDVMKSRASAREVDLNAHTDASLNTALHIAARDGHLGMVRLLHAYGLKPNAINFEDKTPIELAAENGHRRVCEYLIMSCAPDYLTTILNEERRKIAIRKHERFKWPISTKHIVVIP